MASISHLFFSCTTTTSPLFPPSRKPTNPKRHQLPKVTCKNNNNNNHLNSKGEKQPPPSPNNNNILGNRRDVLIGLGGLYGSSTLTNNIINPFAFAAPLAPDLKTCGPPTLPAGAKPTKCCPPPSTTIKDFVFPQQNLPLKIRKPAQLVAKDSEYVAKYKEAIRLMKSLPEDDPRNFTQQANVHCAYCHNSYHQVGFPNLDLQVHFSWIFFPFHRWYLYFYERMLGSLINDPSFALPYWNWDSPDGMEIPAIFTERNSPLYNELRNANHQPPTLMDLNWNKKDVDSSGNVDANLAIMYRQVYEAKRARCFFGKPFRAGQEPYTVKVGSGTLELVPHNVVHSWTGDITQPNTENMGALYSAARDPIFYSHHANVDRMWSIWNSFNRKDIDDSDWLDSSFLFYDENKDLVRVKIRDCLDTKKLGYDFLEQPLPWINTKPKPRRTKIERVVKPLTVTKNLDFPFKLEKIVSTVVNRPAKSRSKEDKEEKEETLVIEVEFDRRRGVKFDVLINEEEDAKFATPVNREFAGSFVNVSHVQTSMSMITDTNFSIGITELLEDLGANDDDSVVVTLVPQYGEGVVIKDIKIDLETC
ncbi:hypothetical protein PIB30_022829 [Stylosanthes scabra]|uniref:Tyrosinase copper-binding domain-containing protein n=1 Tax=Stylosanthes scabra TaxID=79078 RepID=A0ABU6V8F0_9FABA|nr:hypothetical protein [Stylosanthes scabra]